MLRPQGGSEDTFQILRYVQILLSRPEKSFPSVARYLVCKIPLLARRPRPKGRPSAARNDRVYYIQIYITR